MEHFFLSCLKGPAEEDIRFLFLVFIYVSVCKNTAVRNSSLTSCVDKQKVVINIYQSKEYNTEGIFVVKVFTGTISWTLQHHMFPINSPHGMWEIPQYLILLCHCQPFLFCFWYLKTYKFS